MCPISAWIAWMWVYCVLVLFRVFFCVFFLSSLIPSTVQLVGRCALSSILDRRVVTAVHPPLPRVLTCLFCHSAYVTRAQHPPAARRHRFSSSIAKARPDCCTFVSTEKHPEKKNKKTACAVKTPVEVRALHKSHLGKATVYTPL